MLKVPGERIGPELTKMLSVNPARSVKLLRQTGFLAEILPEVEDLFHCEHDSKWHLEGSVGIHTVMVLEQLPPNPGEVLGWGALLHDVGKPATKNGYKFHGHESVGAQMAEQIMQRLRLPGKLIQDAVWLVQNHMNAHRFHLMRKSKLASFVRNENIQDLLHLSYADCMGRSPARDESVPSRDAARALIEELGKKTLKSLGINGHVLITRFGIEPGPQLGKTLKMLDDLMVENPDLDGEGLLALI